MQLYRYYLLILCLPIGLIGALIVWFTRKTKAKFLPWLWIPSLAANAYVATNAIIVSATYLDIHPFRGAGGGGGGSGGPGGGGEFMILIIGGIAVIAALIYITLTIFCLLTLRILATPPRRWIGPSITWLILIGTAWLSLELCLRMTIDIFIVDTSGKPVPNSTFKCMAKELDGASSENQAVTNTQGNIKIHTRLIDNLYLVTTSSDYLTAAINKSDFTNEPPCYTINVRTIMLLCDNDPGGHNSREPEIEEQAEWAVPRTSSLKINLVLPDKIRPGILNWPGSDWKSFVRANLPHVVYPHTFPQAFYNTAANEFVPDLIRLKTTAAISEDRRAADDAMDVLHDHNNKIRTAIKELRQFAKLRGKQHYEHSTCELAQILNIKDPDKNSLTQNLDLISEKLDANDAAMAAALARPFRWP